MLFGGAIETGSEEGEVAQVGREPVVRLQAGAQGVEEVVVDFCLSAALLADKVVVRMAAQFVLKHASPEICHIYEAEGVEEVEGAVDGGLVGGGVSLLDLSQDLFDRKMSVAREHRDNHEAARGKPVSTGNKLAVYLVSFGIQAVVYPPIPL
jgi:hypothetical protein